jgi:hypothetical protein
MHCKTTTRVNLFKKENIRKFFLDSEFQHVKKGPLEVDEGVREKSGRKAGSV